MSCDKGNQDPPTSAGPTAKVSAMMASVFVVVNLLVDVLYGIADPRVSI